MADEQIARLEADVEMHEALEKGQADRERARIDEEERQERLRVEEFQRKAEAKLRMSSVMQRGLPRPPVIDPRMFEADEPSNQGVSKAEKLINEEMLVLMKHDNQTCPLKGMKTSRLPKLDREKVEYSLE